ncbi:MAG TPA: alpha/beta hydrolase [Desulfomonilia bacterium]|nr:alpha/beta hydrolase [Desulfomonilia bacterium]
MTIRLSGTDTIRIKLSWQYRLLGGYFRMVKMFSRSSGSVDLLKERMELEKLGALFKPLAPINCMKADANGVPAEWIAPSGSSHRRTVFFVHGGSYVSGSISSYRALAANIAHAADARALIIDYRLAPENRYPAAVEDAAAAYRWLIGSHAEPGKVVFVGDSSGGSLVLALAVYLRDRGEPLPAAIVSLSPMTDLVMSGETWSTNAKSDILIYPHKEREFARMYLGDADPHTPYASPLYADLKGLPPIFIQVGTPELLLSDSTRFAERARAAGVDVTIEQWEGMQHDWHFTANFVPEGRKAIARIGEFIRSRM